MEFANTFPNLPDSPAPQPQEILPQMLKFTWSKAPDMPQGMQDNDGGVIENWLILAGGFCGGYDDDWKPGKYPRGFLKKVWGLDLTNENKGWIEFPDFPGIARQEMFGINVNDVIYLWGGLSYTAPYAFDDGYKLSRQNGRWVWEELPKLPWKTSTGGICAIGSKIYILGGHDYDKENIYTLTDRTGKIKRFGARILMFDTENPKHGWKELPQCPGTPRYQGGMAAVDGKIYVIGGACHTIAPPVQHSVVDSWCYEPQSDKWTRLRDLPISCGGFSSGNIVYQNRYILLACGYQHPTILNPDGTIRGKYGKPSQVVETWERHPRLKGGNKYFNHFWVYDTKTDLYGTATKLPYDDHVPGTHVIGDIVYLFSGETGGFVYEGEYYGHHPEFVLKGKIEETDWELKYANE